MKIIRNIARRPWPRIGGWLPVMMLICGVLASCSSEDESTAPLPDGKYPLINGEKGILNEWYGISLRQDGKLQIQSVRGGVAGNVVPAHAEAELTGPACISLPEAEGITVTRTEDG